MSSTGQANCHLISGHQKIIDKKFEFARIPLEMLKIKPSLITPNFGKMHNDWSECSELCHLGWTMVAANPDVSQEQYELLNNISFFIAESINGIVSWSKIMDQPFKELEKQFIDGEITREDVQKKLKKNGLWGRVEFNTENQPNQFIGAAVPPAK